ncbi:MAG: AI-2E family transporter [Acidobacteria bacterium]|nr:AI-2E family transporter [Acidobacteriota bacterium]
MRPAEQRRQIGLVQRTSIVLSLTAVAVAIATAAYLARYALLVIYASALLAIGFAPLVRAIEQQKRLPVGTSRLPRWFAILVVYLAILGALTIIVLLVAPPLVRQAAELWAKLPSLAERAQRFLVDRGLLSHPVTLGEAVRQATPGASGSAVGTAAVALTWTMRLIVGVVAVIVLTFYLLIDSGDLFLRFTRLFSVPQRERIVDASSKVTRKLSAWLNGQLMLAATIGTTAAIALYLLGVPYFYVLALIAAAGELIPVIGPLLSAAPAVLVALSVSQRTALWVAIFWLLQQQFENHVLVPKIMQRQVGVSPVIVIGALLIGGTLLGIVGVLLAVPTAAVLQVMVEEIFEEPPA